MAQSQILSSARNPLLKDIRRAITRGSLTESGCAVAETFHLLEEALRSEMVIDTVIAAESVRGLVESHIGGLRNVRLTVVPDALFEELSATESSQGVMSLVRMPTWTLDQLFRGQSLVIVFDGLQDPGNAGAIVRTAEAFGASGVIFLKGTVSPFNAKTLRASAGSLFRMPYLAGIDADMALAAMKQRRVDIYCAMPRAVKPLHEADLTRRAAIIIGGEGRGVSRQLEHASLDLAIPTMGVESLNAAVAAGILLYEARRQRSLQK